jgi:multidrug resistance efflux pump
MVPVKSQLSPDNVRVGGQVIAWRTTTIAAEVSETVSTLPIEVGQKVAADGLIAQLDDAAARAVLAEAEAGLAQATAGRRQLEADYARASVETRAAVVRCRNPTGEGPSRTGRRKRTQSPCRHSRSGVGAGRSESAPRSGR